MLLAHGPLPSRHGPEFPPRKELGCREPWAAPGSRWVGVGRGWDTAVTCGPSAPAGLRHLSGSELTELLDQVEGAIRDFSEELVQQLARRDELEFEKEVKNSFITVLIEVQNKQKEQRELMKKRRKEKGLSLQSSRIEKGSQMPLKVHEPPAGTRGAWGPTPARQGLSGDCQQDPGTH